jgi:hypothetical protein
MVLDSNRSDPEAEAAIYKQPATPATGDRDLVFDSESGDFTMSPNDKLDVPDGHLDIQARNVTTGDLSSLTLRIGSPGEPVELLTVIGRVVGPFELPDGPVQGLDNGPDFNANQVDIYALAATKNPSIPLAGIIVGTPTGTEVSDFVSSNQGLFLLRAIFPAEEGFRDLTPADFVSQVDGDVLDIVARGPGFGPLNVVPYVPTWEEKNPSAVANRSAASERPLREDEVLNWFDCLEKDAGYACEAEVLGAERAASSDAQKVKALAQTLFGETQEDRDRQVLASAVAAYREQAAGAEVDGEAFRRFVEGEPAQAEALSILERYAEVLVGLRSLNVTDEAYDAVKRNKLGKIAPPDLGVEPLGDAVEAGMTAWPTRPGRRMAASDRFYLFQGLDAGRVLLLERVEVARR